MPVKTMQKGKVRRGGVRPHKGSDPLLNTPIVSHLRRALRIARSSCLTTLKLL